MEGCVPTSVCGTKKDEDLLVGQSVEPLPLPSVVDTPELLATPTTASSTLFAVASSFFLSFALIESWATLIISGVTELQSPISCPGNFSKWYFNPQIPPVICCPHNLQFKRCWFVPSLGSTYYANGSKAFVVFAMGVDSFKIQT